MVLNRLGREVGCEFWPSSTVAGIDGPFPASGTGELPGPQWLDVPRGPAAVLGPALQVPCPPSAEVQAQPAARWRTTKRGLPPTGRSPRLRSRRSSWGPGSGLAPVVPKRCCPAAAAGRPRRESSRSRAPPGGRGLGGNGWAVSGPPTPSRGVPSSPPRSPATSRRPLRIPQCRLPGFAVDGGGGTTRGFASARPAPLL